MNLERPDGSFNREKAIRLVTWAMCACSIVIALAIAQMIRTGSFWVWFTGVPSNVLAIVVGYYGRKHMKRQLREEQDTMAQFDALERAVKAGNVDSYRSLTTESDD